MKLLLVSVTRNRKGQAARAERALEGELLRIGRGAQCEIHLPDPRVALDHGAIFEREGGIVVSAPNAEITVDGGVERDLRLAPGMRLGIGPYDLVVAAPPAGVDLALEVELARPLPDELAAIRAQSRTTLAATGLRKRLPALLLTLAILIAFLAVPLINAVIPPLRALSGELALAPDHVWDPGPLSAGHRGFGGNCATCHRTPFLRVRDAACLGCHREIAGHLEAAAKQSDLFGHTRCASCHADHKGAAGLVRRDPGLCVACHDELKRHLADTTLADVTDFASGHPEFKLSLVRGPGPKDVVRVAQSDKANLVESSNLRFPHAEHLQASIRGPKGRRILECGSCHRPDAAGKGFVPVSMTRDCLECHVLEFEPAVTTRQVPHGSANDALLTMQEFYASIALNDIPVDVIDLGEIRRGLPRLTGGTLTEEQRTRALAWAKAKAQAVARDLFEARVCIVCHDITRTTPSDPRSPGTDAVIFGVAPVRVAARWMPKARFDHARHDTVKCAECHPVDKSRASSDISIPDIASCRKCHTGSASAAGRVASTCVSCHGFHYAGRPPLGSVRAAGSVTTPPAGARRP